VTRRTLALMGLVAVVLAGVLTWNVMSRADSALTVSVTVRSDTEEPVEVYRGRQLFSASSNPRPEMHAEVDLSPWQGQLIRIDVTGEVRPSPAKVWSTGYAACQGQIVDGNTTIPLEFVGWDNSDPEKPRVGSLGCHGLSVREDDGDLFAYTTDASLWYVVRLPERARLELSVMPVMKDEVSESPHACVSPITDCSAPSVPQSRSTKERPPDIFIYLVDALRADHLGCYGYERRTSHMIDEFASNAVLYERAQAASTWTRSSVASVLTGLYPAVHGVLFNHKSEVLPQWPVLLPEVLRAEGYRTYGIGTNPHISKLFGFDQGWDYYVAKGWKWKATHGGTHKLISSETSRILAGLSLDQPVFMYLHTLEPHTPYMPSANAFQRFDRGFKGRYDGSAADMRRANHVRPDVTDQDLGFLIDLYDAEIFEADVGFAEFLDVLRGFGRLENALIIFVADHGEAFAEHNTLIHGRSLNQEELHVPLIIRFPGDRFAGMHIEREVSLVDIFPTILNVVGCTAHTDYELAGCDISPSAVCHSSAVPRPVYAEVSIYENRRLHLLGVIDEDAYKGTFDVSKVPGKVAPDETVGLWDTAHDPKEQTNLRDSLPVRAAYHEQLVARWLLSKLHGVGKSEDTIQVEMDEETRRALETLGYLD